MNRKNLRRVFTLPKRTTPPTRLPAEQILGVLTPIRNRSSSSTRPHHAHRNVAAPMPTTAPLETAEDFEYAAVIDGIESLANDLGAVLAQKRAALLEEALDVYYAAEELARDPEHADLIEAVEKMRAVYERDYGGPIPPKREK